MIFNKRQLMTFKQVRERTWYAQNRLREPYIKNWRNILKIFFNKFADKVKIAYSNRSQIELDIELRKQTDQLRRIFRVQYNMIASAFRDHALGRFFVKDFPGICRIENTPTVTSVFSTSKLNYYNY